MAYTVPVSTAKGALTPARWDTAATVVLTVDSLEKRVADDNERWRVGWGGRRLQELFALVPHAGQPLYLVRGVVCGAWAWCVGWKKRG